MLQNKNTKSLCLCKQTPLIALMIICCALWVNKAEAGCTWPVQSQGRLN